MSADNENTPPKGHRFNVEDARVRAQEALRKSEFILSRAYGLLREPKKEWEQIKAEQTTIPHILIGYVAPLAAIPPVCDLIGSALFNRLLTIEPGEALVRAVVTWVVSCSRASRLSCHSQKKTSRSPSGSRRMPALAGLPVHE